MRFHAALAIVTLAPLAGVGCSLAVDVNRFNSGDPVSDSGAADTSVAPDSAVPDVAMPDTATTTDAPSEETADTSVDTTVDAGADTTVDTGAETTVDTGVDSGVDAPVDAPLDAGRRPIIYLGGGSIDTTKPKDMLRADLLATGDVTMWTNLGSVLPASASSNIAVRTPTHVYVLGPDYVVDAATVRYAKISASGDLTGWASTKTLTARGRLTGVTNGAYLYAIGGVERVSSAEVPRADVYYAPILGDGTPGSFAAGRALPGPRAGACAVVVDNRIYVMAGFDTADTRATVFRADIKSDGTLDPWIAQNALSFPVSGCSAVTAGKRIFVLGGYGAQDTVQHALVGVDGTVGPWITAAAKMPAKHAYFQAVTAGGYVVAAGGFESASTAGANVDIAPISEAGIGTWKASTPLPVARMFLIGFAVE